MSNPSKKLTSGMALGYSVTGNNRFMVPQDRENPCFLRAWRAAREKLAVSGGQVNIICAGHSWVQGNAWVRRLRDTLQARYGAVGQGYFRLSDNNTAPDFMSATTTGTWTTKDGNSDATTEGIDLWSTTSSDTATPAKKVIQSFAQALPYEQITIHYYCRTGGGSFTYALDAVGTVNTANTSGTYSTITWVSGVQFNSSMTSVIVNGVTYIVFFYTSATSLAVYGLTGTQTGVAYSTPGAVAATTVSTNSSAGYSMITITGIGTSSTAHTLTLTITAAGSTGVTLLGLDARCTSIPGVLVHNLGHSGSTSANWAAVNAANWEAGITAVGGSDALVIFECVINDAAAASNPITLTQAQTFDTNIREVTARMQAACVYGDVLLIGDPDNGTGHALNLQTLADYTRDAAQALNAAFLDIGLSWGPYAAANARGNYLAGNHPNDQGGRIIAGSIAALLIADDQAATSTLHSLSLTQDLPTSGVFSVPARLIKVKGVLRWAEFATQTQETGANAGSDWHLYAYDDAGAFLGEAIGITRSTLAVTIPHLVQPAAYTNLLINEPTHTGGNVMGWQVGSLNRWILFGTQGSETGSNAGSDFRIYRYDDAGTVIGSNVFQITRSTGLVTIPSLSVGALTLPAFNPNTVYAGPASGGAGAAPVSRALVLADMPAGVGTGTVTHSVGALSTGKVVVGNGGDDVQIATAAASGGAVATTAATNVAPYGFTTAAQADAIITLLNNIRSALVANGIMN